MRKYRKGRVLVLSGMVAFSSLTVLAGTSAAQSGKLTVKWAGTMPSTLTTKQARELKKHNRFYGACLDVTSFGFTSKNKKIGDNPTATFELKGGGYKYFDGSKISGKDRKTTLDTTFITPTDGYNGTAEYDLGGWLAGFTKRNGKVDKKGYHVEISYGGKHRSVWIQNAIKCDGTGQADAPVQIDCLPNHFVSKIDPTVSGNALEPGVSTLGVVWQDQVGDQTEAHPLDKDSIAVTLTNTNSDTDADLSNDVNVSDNGDGTSTITVTVPQDAPKYGNIAFSADEVDSNPDSNTNTVECGYYSWDTYVTGGTL